jgi:hypothetical protein
MHFDAFEKALPGSTEYFSTNSTLFELVIDSVHFQKSSGVVDTLMPEDFRHAKEDEIAKTSRALIEKANSEYGEKLRRVCEKYGEVVSKECFIFGLDHKGFDVLSQDREGAWTQLRFPWDSPVISISDYHTSLFQFLNDKSK